MREQLAIAPLPGSAAAALVGVLAGQIYRSDLANLKGYRLPLRLAALASRVLLPLLGSLRPARRSNRALPDDAIAPDSTAARPQNDEVVTTARRPPPASSTVAQRTRADPNAEPGSGGSVVREWVEGLTGRAQTGVGRIPTEAEITQLTTMFPDIQRDVLVGTLQRRCVCLLPSLFSAFSPRCGWMDTRILTTTLLAQISRVRWRRC
ncbi:hypothetical protein B0H17DRAFT_650263 [Mycena rosella]|uniref:CUE domain-containing protein n=1 Tax=Mycena rosella TaxID=1033263 RepID=A0AAD7DCW9_MYCRO|nr:hypothetical protein B0H17DRAFT_650263 [Mycena rosella]